MASYTRSECTKCGESVEFPAGFGRPRSRCDRCAGLVPVLNVAVAMACTSCGDAFTRPARSGSGRPTTRCECCREHVGRARHLKVKARLRSARSGRVCDQCGDTYDAARSDQRFCSPTCRGLHTHPSRGLVTKLCCTCEHLFAKAGPAAARQDCDDCYAVRLQARQIAKSLARRGLVEGALERISRDEIAVRDDWTCQLCVIEVDPTLRYPDPLSASLDHVIPIARGGQHVRSNLQLAHLVCNMSKGAGRGADGATTEAGGGQAATG